MQPSKTERLSGIVAALDEYIDLVRSYNMQETAVLLGMAKLDLQMKIHSVSDRELHALCDALEIRHARMPEHGAAPGSATAADGGRGRGEVVEWPIAAHGEGAPARGRGIGQRRSPRVLNRFRRGS